MNPVRIGLLGAARVAPYAIVEPCARAPAAGRIAAVAAREPARAREFAERHGIPSALGSYAELVASNDLDAVYVGLPNGLHAEWSIKALEAGKHVLCEKPLASNEREAREIAAAAKASGKVFMDAFHYRYHPFYAAVEAIVRSGELGTPRFARATFRIPDIPRADIRFSYGLAGGSLMDPTCYPVDVLLALFGADPEVAGARMRLGAPKVDRSVRAELRFPGGLRAVADGSLRSLLPFRTSLVVRGDRGTLEVRSPWKPAEGGRILVRTRAGTEERAWEGRDRTTYDCQLEAFAAAIREGKPFPTTAESGVAYMRTIDRIYRKAGLSPRGEPS